jgi:hypothetical protein
MTDYERGYEQGKADAMKLWVGLTEEELLKIWVGTPAESEYWFAFAQAIEAKLKEKNNV